MLKNILAAIALLALVGCSKNNTETPYKSAIGATMEEVQAVEGEPAQTLPQGVRYDNVKWQGFTGELFYLTAPDGTVGSIAYSVTGVDKEKVLAKVDSLYEEASPDVFYKIYRDALTAQKEALQLSDEEIENNIQILKENTDPILETRDLVFYTYNDLTIQFIADVNEEGKPVCGIIYYKELS
jgi:hypothetical protein